MRDLGVEMSSDLTFDIHILNVVSAANQLVGWAMRTVRRRSKLIMLTIWKCLIQSKLDYTSQLWSPSDQSVLPGRNGREELCLSFATKCMVNRAKQNNVSFTKDLNVVTMLVDTDELSE